MPLSRDSSGVTSDGVAIDLYRLVNSNGLQADIMTWGGTLVGLRMPDRNGVMADVVLGFDLLEPYLGEHPYFGNLIGRFANRIADGRFELNGITYTLARNNGRNHLHGGPEGFHRRVWQAREVDSPEGAGLELRYVSSDGEEGYPGILTATVTYTLTEQDELRIQYLATTDRDTIVNLTNHAYFNLAGSGNILGHELELAASRFLPIDETSIPIGEPREVRGTPMDFLTPTLIGARIAADDKQIRNGQGYDHNWVLDEEEGALGLAARLRDPSSGRVMEVLTTQPGVQFYSGNLLDGSLTGKGGQRYDQYSGLCLETQHFPDSPNQPHFPSTVLRPGEIYDHTTLLRFSVDST
jgi:aldose 1-epimerase